MPIGAFKLNTLAKYSAPTSIATIYGGGYVSQYGKFVRSYYNPTASAGITINQSSDYTFNSGQDFTVEGWIWFGSTASNKYLFDGRPDSKSLVILCDGNYLKVYIDGAYRISTATADMLGNQWYHIAYSRSGSTGRLFRNGTLIGSWTDTINYSHSNTLKIATRYVEGQGAADTFVDEFRISRTARYTSAFTPSTTGFSGDANTVLLLHMDEAQNSTVIYDSRSDVYSSSAGTNPRASVFFQDNFGGVISTAQSKFGGASWYQDAEYDGASMNDESPLDPVGSGEFTLEMWVRRQDNPTRTVAYLWTGNTNQFALYYDESTNQLKYSTSGTVRITGGSISLNTWTHIAVVRNSSSSTKLYINGTQSGSTTTVDDRNWVNVTQYTFGVDGNGLNSWVGYIDEIRISNTQRYTSTFTPSTSEFINDSNTLMLLHMNGANNSTAIVDNSG